MPSHFLHQARYKILQEYMEVRHNEGIYFR